jgi:photosystem II stability/assembly factor-like uncharacterized protein
MKTDLVWYVLAVGLASCHCIDALPTRVLSMEPCPILAEASPSAARAASVAVRGQIVRWVAASEPGHVWAVALEYNLGTGVMTSALYRSSDCGRSFVRSLLEEEPYYMSSICFVGDTEGWICGGHGLLLHTLDKGDTWVRTPFPSVTNLDIVEFTNSLNGWALNRQGTVYSTTDGGGHWRESHLHDATDIRGLAFRDSKNGWAVGTEGRAYETMDGGLTWRDRGAAIAGMLEGRIEGRVDFVDVSFVSAMVGYIAANVAPNKDGDPYDGATLFKTSDGAVTWHVVAADRGHAMIRTVARGNDVWMVSMDPGKSFLHHSPDGGKSWSTLPNAPSAFSPLVFSDPKNGWGGVSAGEWMGEIYYTADGGLTWRRSRLPDD